MFVHAELPMDLGRVWSWVLSAPQQRVKLMVEGGKYYVIIETKPTPGRSSVAGGLPIAPPSPRAQMRSRLSGAAIPVPVRSGALT